MRPESFSAKETASLAGITYRMLDYWARTDLIRPSVSEAHGSGTRRHYNARDIKLLRIICAALHMGMSLTVVRGVIEELTESALEEGTFLVCRTMLDTHTQGGNGRYDGGSIVVTSDPEGVFRLVSEDPVWIMKIKD